MKGSPKGKNDVKPPLGKQPSGLTVMLSSNIIFSLEQSLLITPTNADGISKNENTVPRPRLEKRKSSKLSKQSLVITYSTDPTGFEEVSVLLNSICDYFIRNWKDEWSLLDFCSLRRL
jgi:hypothetical protein